MTWRGLPGGFTIPGQPDVRPLTFANVFAYAATKGREHLGENLFQPDPNRSKLPQYSYQPANYQ